MRSFLALRPRERLVEDDLCVKFGASRHQIRAAFAELERIGLVTRRPNKGVVVRDFSAEEIEQSFEVGALLQAEAAQRIQLPLDSATMRKLEDIYKTYCAASNRLDLEQVVANTMRVPPAVFEASNNKCLSEIIREIWTKTFAVRATKLPFRNCWSESSKSMHKFCKPSDRRTGGISSASVPIKGKRALEAYKRLHGGWPSQNRPAYALPRASRPNLSGEPRGKLVCHCSCKAALSPIGAPRVLAASTFGPTWHTPANSCSGSYSKSGKFADETSR